MDAEEIISISKEEVAALPLTGYKDRIVLVETPAQLTAALCELNKCRMVGFDTETKPCFKKGQKHNVALMQLATPGCCYLLRLNKLGITRELKAFLEDPSLLKIGLSIHDDFNVLNRTMPISPQGFVDLQDLVKDYDITDISLQKIYAIVFGKRISKGQRLTNWEAETLTPAQQAYAALDAWACLELFQTLTSEEFDPFTSPYRHAVNQNEN